jgi:hypothetical protein
MRTMSNHPWLRGVVGGLLLVASALLLLRTRVIDPARLGSSLRSMGP